MSNVLAYLNNIDFSKIEAKLYIELLKTGSLTVSTLAEKQKLTAPLHIATSIPSSKEAS